ncbi:MAG: hypothetical protein HC902_13880 [Calothrix sp. SM1_5_4]|nr:hypothetical protein [Calothrix sp. SM1_5_4]
MRFIFFARPLLLLSALWLAPNVGAHTPADGDIRVSVGQAVSKTHEWHHHFDSPLTGGFAFLAEADLDRHGGLEIAAFFVPQIFSVEQGGRVITQSAKRVHITTGYRFWFDPRYSISLGFFSSYAMGDPQDVQNEFASSPPNTSARDMTDYGFDLSMQVEPYQNGRYSLILDGRYSYSVTPKAGEDMNQFTLFAGIKYFVQGRGEASTPASEYSK